MLRADRQLQHRGAERPKQQRKAKPRALCGTAPRQLFSWGITYLPTRVMGRYFYLYLSIDIFSHKIVSWQVHEAESSELASEVMRDICLRENLRPQQVVLDSDNDSPMKGAAMLATLQALGVMPSLSRPSVGNHIFLIPSRSSRALKYCPHYPRQAFEHLLAARQWVGAFVHWYNLEHRYSAIRFVTHQERHAGQASALLSNRTDVYEPISGS